MSIDLHIHSVYSDGAWTPAELVKDAKEKQLSAISLTDHDTIAGLVEARKQAELVGIQFVDGVEIGPMNHHWTGGTDKKTTVDWVSGQDFIFTRMGSTPHTIGNCYIEYIMVSEDGTAG